MTQQMCAFYLLASQFSMFLLYTPATNTVGCVKLQELFTKVTTETRQKLILKWRHAVFKLNIPNLLHHYAQTLLCSWM